MTWAYFSVSATWNWRQPACDRAPASDGTSSGREGDLDRQVGLVLGHRDDEQVARRRAAVRAGPIEPVEVGVGEGVRQLASAVRPEVGMDDRIAVADPPVDTVDDRRPDELVVLAPGVARLRPPPRAEGARSPAPWTIAW